ncbi:GNAT family N-acetyltransferase [Halosegnis marinus]|uniref:GNAT family N-acetyltransferase n=1 Tax=Halosegnis marinus TaxID=3034023 RepID=A0ABD5ZMS4_9EURY|nr:GNAT family N-acetyltransferase [Halosegnis sp. DT85]
MSRESPEGADGPRLRRATDADSDALVALHRSAIRAAGSDPDDVPGNEDLRDIERAFHGAGGELLVVEDGNDPVAMGGFKPRDGDTVEVVRMAVADGARGEGYGSRVLAELERRAREAGYEGVVLETTARQERAMAFYPRRGYEETGRRTVGEYEVVAFGKPL